MLIMNALLEVAPNHCHWLDQISFQSDWPFVMTSNIEDKKTLTVGMCIGK